MTGTESANTEMRTGVLHGKISYLRKRNRITKRSTKTVGRPSLLVEKTILMLKDYLKNVIKDALVYALEDKRESVSASDISKALKKQDLISCDKNFSSASGEMESSVDKDALN